MTEKGARVNVEYSQAFGLRSVKVDQRPLQGTHLVEMLGVKRGCGIPGILFKIDRTVICPKQP